VSSSDEEGSSAARSEQGSEESEVDETVYRAPSEAQLPAEAALPGGIKFAYDGLRLSL
jgi:hypothetical protein